MKAENYPDRPSRGCSIQLLLMILVFILCLLSCKTLYDTNRIVVVSFFDGKMYHSVLRDNPNDSILFLTKSTVVFGETYLLGENRDFDVVAIPVPDDYTFSGNSNVVPIFELCTPKKSNHEKYNR